MKKIIHQIKKAWYYAWHRHHLLIPFPALKRYFKSFTRNVKKSGGISTNIFTSSKDYNKWLKDHPLKNIKCNNNLDITILYSITKFNKEIVIKTLNSIFNSNYTKYCITIAIFEKDYLELNDLLKRIQPKRLSIKIITCPDDKPLADLYNKALKEIGTDYICFINSNVVFEKVSLNYIKNSIEKGPDIIYSDEDHIDNKFKLSKPVFKPDFALDSFLGYNYLGNVITIKTSLAKKVGSFSKEYLENTFSEYLLKCVCKAKKIVHIPEILYHDFSDMKNNFNSQIISDYLKNNKIDAQVDVNPYNKEYVIKYNHDNPLVSIIIPFKDQFALTKDCVTSLLNNLSYKNYELILIDNGSQDKELLNWLKQINDNKRVKVYHNPMPFNFSAICNYGASKAKGEYYLLLNNDTKIINNDFLDWMVGYAKRKDIGAVGLKLLYNDKKIQHMGVALTEGGFATHFGVTEKDNQNGLFDMRIRPYNFSAVTGACLMVEKKKYKDVGGLDEKLTVALNDMDLCLKLLNKGYYNICLNNITMFHFESKSRGYDENIDNNNRLNIERIYMKNKWGKDFELDKYYSKYFF